ncbi:hypothetical protein [Amycolatopsis sp. NPDC051903]|uniref:hypothetical protein n=1 Tax=Amycolatopsis sp. NPDC051903 TaxID=3363936 RepID=UPI0037A06812
MIWKDVIDMSWLLAIFTGAVLFLLHKKWKKWNKWFTVGAITALFSCSLAATGLGGFLASLLGDLLSAIARIWGGSGALFAAVLVLIALPAVIYGFVHDKKADRWEMTGLIMLPLLFTIASGPVAAHGGTFSDAVEGFGSQGLSYLVQG